MDRQTPDEDRRKQWSKHYDNNEDKDKTLNVDNENTDKFVS